MLLENSYGPAVFETERLVAYQWHPSMAEAAFQIYSDEQVTRYIGGKTDDDVETVRKRLEALIVRNQRWPQCYGSWPVFLKSSGELVGNALLKPLPDPSGNDTEDIEIGWHLGRQYWGNGYATEFARELLERGFEMAGQSRLLAVVHPENQASSNVALRVGMKHLGQTEKYYDEGAIELYELLKSDG